MLRLHVLGYAYFLFQAVDSLVHATGASTAGKVATGLPSASSSTADDAIPRVTYPVDQRSRVNSQVMERVSERPTAACTNELEDEIVADGHADVSQVRAFDRHFFTDHGEVKALNGPVEVKGRLKVHIDFWQKINAPAFILDCISRGYKIPFYATPATATFPNNASAKTHAEFVTKSIQDLLLSGRIVKTQKNILFVINPLSVSVQNKGKMRLILDLRYVNKHIFKQKIKFEDWKTAINYFGTGKFFTKFDLKSGYHHLDIFPAHQPYLGFFWPSPSGQENFYMFTVLPFGLSSAPYIFTKLVRPLIKHWRAQGICITVFLDDGMDMENSIDIARGNGRIIRSDIWSSGFVPNDEKSVWEPIQVITWLGLTWNGVLGTIEIAPHRVTKLISSLREVLHQEKISARNLASVVGQIISTGPVTGNLSQIMSRHCQISIVASSEWDLPFALDGYCQSELRFWLKNIQDVNARKYQESAMASKTIYSDASSHACGALLGGTDQVAHRMFTEAEQARSSTFRELLAVQFGIVSFKSIIQGCNVKWFTDNQSAAKIAQVGSMTLECHHLAIEIFSTCFTAGIQLDIQWIPRAENTGADCISKFIDYDDWEITLDTFAI